MKDIYHELFEQLDYTDLENDESKTKIHTLNDD